MAASASNKEFARQFALVVVTPNDRLNDMVARSGYVAPLRRAMVMVRPAGATGNGAHTQARGSAVLCVCCSCEAHAMQYGYTHCP